MNFKRCFADTRFIQMCNLTKFLATAVDSGRKNQCRYALLFFKKVFMIGFKEITYVSNFKILIRKILYLLTFVRYCRTHDSLSVHISDSGKFLNLTDGG